MCLLHRISAHLEAFLFWVANGNYQNLGPGMIGGNAEVNVIASSISTGDFFDQILNYGGASIGGHAAINLTFNTLTVGGQSRFQDRQLQRRKRLGVTPASTWLRAGGINAQGGVVFSIANSNFNSGSGGGTIGGDATINVRAQNITANTLSGFMLNDGGGNIGGKRQPQLQSHWRSHHARRCELLFE